MTKQDVIERLCKLVTKVGSKQFNHEIPHDCFCHESGTGENGFCIDGDILTFIEESVVNAINNDAEVT